MKAAICAGVRCRNATFIDAFEQNDTPQPAAV
jgi:hypothetical protein